MDVRSDAGTFPRPSPNSSATFPINTDTNDSKPPAKKRRTSTPASRGVANLTPEQLAKKRANDREAQRAIRERTKGQIETLERKIHELTSQQPYQDLQNVIRQKELVEAENVEIKKRLHSVIGIIQPLLGINGAGQNGFSPDGIYESDNKALDLALSSYRTAPNLQLECNAKASSGPQNNPGLLNLTPQTDPATLQSSTPSSSTYTSPPQVPQQTSHFSPPASYTPQSTGPNFALDRQRSNLAHGLDLRASGEKLDLGFLLDSPQGTRHGRPEAPVAEYKGLTSKPLHVSNPVLAGRRDRGFESPICAYATPIRNISPTCPLDGLLLDFLAERQRQAAEGVSSQSLVGPPYPSVSSLLNPERSRLAHPLSKVFTDIISTFPDLSNLPEQVAVLYVMFLIMRWQISPTQENYDRLPEWVTPRPSQLFTPHPAWIDHLPWPRMRDKMVYLYPNIAFDSWFIPYTTTLSLNWPYEPTDTLISMPDSDELSINPVFERHIRDLNNWSLGPAFAKAFPMLVETTKIKPETPRRQSP